MNHGFIHACIFQPFTDELHSCSYARESTVIGFWKHCFGNTDKSAAVLFFEYAAKSAGGERLRREGETSHSWGETGDIILLNES